MVDSSILISFIVFPWKLKFARKLLFHHFFFSKRLIRNCLFGTVVFFVVIPDVRFSNESNEIGGFGTRSAYSCCIDYHFKLCIIRNLHNFSICYQSRSGRKHRGFDRRSSDVFHWKNERACVCKVAQYVGNDASRSTISRNLISDGIERLAGMKKSTS